VNDEFFDFYKQNKDNDRLVKFLHIPLQSGSNKMLQLMKRGYSREEFVEKLHTIHKINPMSFIGTDVIVGFLDETDKDFEDTYSFLEQTPISKFHVFRFSKRNHTAAFYMSKRLTEPTVETKLKRAKALAELGKKKYEAFVQTHVGKTFSVLLLEKREGEWQHGLLSNQIPVMVKTDKNLAGEIRNVKITAKKDDNLMAAII
jgi:threonylcarbamoyladenosine tRNA methylthiotransferase MtaB